jgi:hypothetical protein
MEEENVSLKIYNYLDFTDEIYHLFQCIQIMFVSRMKINRNYVLCSINEKPVSYASFYFVNEKCVVIDDYTNGYDYVGITILLKTLINTFLSKKNDIQIYAENISHIHLCPIISHIFYSTTTDRRQLFYSGSNYDYVYKYVMLLTFLYFFEDLVEIDGRLMYSFSGNQSVTTTDTRHQIQRSIVIDSTERDNKQGYKDEDGEGDIGSIPSEIPTKEVTAQKRKATLSLIERQTRGKQKTESEQDNPQTQTPEPLDHITMSDATYEKIKSIRRGGKRKGAGRKPKKISQ